MSPYNVANDNDYDDVIDNFFPNFKENSCWKCGEIYTWNDEEVYAVECTLCDDKSLCSLLEFPKHIQDFHRNFECTSDEEKSEHKTSDETFATIADMKESSSMETPPTTCGIDEIKEKKFVAKDSDVVLHCNNEESTHRSNKSAIETALETVIETDGLFYEKEEKKSKGNLFNANRDQLWRKIVAEATADEIETESTINYSRLPNDDNRTLQKPHQIAAGQDRASSFQKEQKEEAINERKGVTQSIKDVNLTTIKSHKKARFNKDLSSLQTKLNTEQMTTLIDLYKTHPRLWNPTHEEFSRTELCDESWNEISLKFNETTKQAFKINELKLAISSLCHLYRVRIKENDSKDNLKFNNDYGDEHKEKEKDGVEHFKILNFLNEQVHISSGLIIPIVFENHYPYTGMGDILLTVQWLTGYWIDKTWRDALNKNIIPIKIVLFRFIFLVTSQLFDKANVGQMSTVVVSRRPSEKRGDKNLIKSISLNPFFQLDASENRRQILYKQNLKIIEIYKRFPLLWHSSDEYKQTPMERSQALDKMSDILRREHQIELSCKSIQVRLHALHKYYQKEKLKYLRCLKENRKFRTNFKHFEQMQFLQKHIAPFECNSCSKIFEKLHERNEHMNTWHRKNIKQQRGYGEKKQHQQQKEPNQQLLEPANDMSTVNFFIKNETISKGKSTDDAQTEGYNSRIIASADRIVKKEKRATDGVEIFLTNLLEKESFMETAANIFTQKEDAIISPKQGIYVNSNNNDKADNNKVDEDKPLELAPQSLHHYSIKQMIAGNEFEATIKHKTGEKQLTQDFSKEAGITICEVDNVSLSTKDKSNSTDQISNTFKKLLNPARQQLHPIKSNESTLSHILDEPVNELNTQILINSTEETINDNVEYLRILNSPIQNLSFSVQQHQQISPPAFDTTRVLNATPSTLSDSPKSLFNFQSIPYSMDNRSGEDRTSPQISTGVLTQALSNAFTENDLNVSHSKTFPTQLFDENRLTDSTYEITNSSNLLGPAQTFQIVASDSTQATTNSPFHTIPSPAISRDQYFLESPPLNSNPSAMISVHSAHQNFNSPSLTILNNQQHSDNLKEHLNSTSPHILDPQYYLNTQRNSDTPVQVNSRNLNLLNLMEEENLISQQDLPEIVLTTKDDTNLLRKLLNPERINTITQPGVQYTLHMAENTNHYLPDEISLKNSTHEGAEVLNTQNFLYNIFQEDQLNTQQLFNTNIQTSKPFSVYTANNLLNHDTSQYVLQSAENIPNIYLHSYQPVDVREENTLILANKTQFVTCPVTKSKELPKNELNVYEILVKKPKQLISSEERDNTNAIIITQKPINVLQGQDVPQISVNHLIGKTTQHNLSSPRTAMNEVNLTQSHNEQLMSTSPVRTMPVMAAYSTDDVNTEYVMKAGPLCEELVINTQEDCAINEQNSRNCNKKVILNNSSQPIVLNGDVRPTRITIPSSALTQGYALSKIAKNNCKLDLKNVTLQIKDSNTPYTNPLEVKNVEVKTQDSIIQCEVFIPENFNTTDSIDSITLIPCAAISNRFNEKRTHHLISIYKKQPVLWDPFHKDFHSRNAKRVAWKSITVEFNKLNHLRVPWQTIYKKLTDLVKYYRKEKERVKKQNLTSKWYCYEDFQFLDGYLDITSDTNKMVQEKEVNLKIIETYKSYPQLWNTHLLQFKRRSQRSRNIQAMLNSLREGANIQITLDKLKRKLLEFRCCYRQEKEKRIECTKNNEAFESSYEYYQQLDFLEPHIAPFVCKVCGESFKKVTEITRHYRLTKHQKLSKKRIHLRSSPTPENDAKNICHICGAKFTMRNNLIYHLNRHTGKRTHSCKLCPKSFYNSTSLRVHERSHTKECPCVCEECGQAFVNNSKLNQHRKRHGDQRNHVCTECNKAFFTAFERDKHAKSHLKIRNQVCPICGKAFYFGSAIYTHMKIHNEEKKYVCKICDKRFSQNSGLYRHKKSHLAQNENEKPNNDVTV